MIKHNETNKTEEKKVVSKHRIDDEMVFGKLREILQEWSYTVV